MCLGSEIATHYLAQGSRAYAEGVEFAVLPELLALVAVETVCLARTTVCLGSIGIYPIEKGVSLKQGNVHSKHRSVSRKQDMDKLSQVCV